MHMTSEHSMKPVSWPTSERSLDARILASLKMKNCTRDRGDVIIAFIYDA